MRLTWDQVAIDTGGRTSGQIKTFCPKCRNDRKHGNQHDKPLSVNLDTGVWKCHNCTYQGSLHIAEQREYQKPNARPLNLSPKVKKWFRDRGIEERTLEYFKITESWDWMPEGKYGDKILEEGKRTCINFNYFRDNELVNIKYRDVAKNFRLSKDCELIFYNLDAIKGSKECCIVEGECDAMAMYQAGYFYCISVPNGASKSNTQSLKYLDNCWEAFEDKEKIYIAVDNDEAGGFLKNELVRRLGSDRCFIINLEDCKDANEYLLKRGASALYDRFNHAEAVPFKGIWQASAFREKIMHLYKYGREKPSIIHMGEFDNHLKFRKGDFTVITGIPSHGKSYWTLWMTVLLSSFYGWKWVLFAPENMPEEELVGIIASMFIGENMTTDNPTFKMKEENLELALKFVEEHYYFFKFDETDIDVDSIGDIFKQCVKKYGVNGGVIDPWNKIDHSMEKGDSETQYINKTLSKLTALCKINGMHIFFVAHPTKMTKDLNTKQYHVPNLYNISGSAHFYNQSDNGLVIYRNQDNSVDVIIEKVRWRFCGESGKVLTNFDPYTGRYMEYGKDYMFPYRYWLELKNEGTIHFEEQLEKPIEVNLIDTVKETEADPLPW